MATVSEVRATIADLYRTEGKAELIKGRIVRFMPSGELPNAVAFEIAVSLRAHAKITGIGHAYTDGLGYAVPELPSGRESFSPDDSYHTGPRAANRMRFIDGAPIFAVEVRSENDYGDAAEEDMAAKRADYFQAGTLVVWDVDPVARTVTAYRADQIDEPTTFSQGEMATAEPAVAGWRIAVDEVFAG